MNEKINWDRGADGCFKSPQEREAEADEEFNDLERRVETLENILLDLANAAMDDNVTGNDIINILKKYGVKK